MSTSYEEIKRMERELEVWGDGLVMVYGFSVGFIGVLLGFGISG